MGGNKNPGFRPLSCRCLGVAHVSRSLSSRASSIPTLQAALQGWNVDASSSAPGLAYPLCAAAAGTAVALMYSMNTQETSSCKSENIVWIHSHGKKVPVHEKDVTGAREGAKGVLPPGRCGYFAYVIVGYGVAGRAALRALLERDPGARVLVVDAETDEESLRMPRLSPHDGVTNSDGDSSSNALKRSQPPAHHVEFVRGTRAAALDADRGVLVLSGSEEAGERSQQEVVRFGRCLLATGSKPKPPPAGFVDPAVRTDPALLGWKNQAVRDELRDAVAAGKAVTVVGSSWEALELACWLQEGRAGSDKGVDGGCRMVFPDYAPLDHILPRYLSIALLRRLNKKHIKTTGHSSVRWVGRFNERISTTEAIPGAQTGFTGTVRSESSSTPSAVDGGDEEDRKQAGASSRKQQPLRQPRLNVMTCHSFDHLDTATHTTDRVVLAGLDMAPLSATLDILGEKDPGGKRRSSGALEIDARRGAVVVNAGLAASSRIWAAGDAAYFPSHAHGGRRLVLRMVDHAHHSGLVAGHNMAASALDADAVFASGGAGLSSLAQDEGQRIYRHSPAFVGEAPLAGVRIAMVGDCNAALPTHGFWWTNNAMGLTRSSTSSSRSEVEKPKRMSAKGVSLKSRKSVRREFIPVLGTGVIFYTSGAEVKGAMLWGFPGAAAAAAAAAQREGSPEEGDGATKSAAIAAAGLSARALDLLREVMKRSASIEADLADERVMNAWLQGLSDAARIVAQEIGVGHLQPFRRSVPGRETTSTRRPAGSLDELMYENTAKTISADKRLKAAYMARIKGVMPASPFSVSSGLYGSSGDGDEPPELMEFLGNTDGVFESEEAGEGGDDVS